MDDRLRVELLVVGGGMGGLAAAASAAEAGAVVGVVEKGPAIGGSAAVQPAITFANTGVRVDTAARVLDADDLPIANLHAAGVDVGGFYDVGYAGGLAASLVLGWQAARTAVQHREPVAAGDSRGLRMD